MRIHSLVMVGAFLCLSLYGQTKMEFWDTQRKGTNFFNEEETLEHFQSARKEGIEVVRLTFNKWKSARAGAVDGDFLLGPKEKFMGIVHEDLPKLIQVLDWAEQSGLKVVITNLSVPGLRWIQQNQSVPDHRLWQDFKYHRETEIYWKELATVLKDHPAVVGYNLLNEPHPEKVPPVFSDWFSGDYGTWKYNARHTPRDLNLFHRELVKAIREVDSETPVILDAGFYAHPWAFKVLDPVKDPHVLYSFHMYEPFAFTSHENRGKYSYPGEVPIGENANPPIVHWDASDINTFLEPVRAWSKQHAIPANRIFASEFGVFRVNNGAASYLEDVVSSLKSSGWHWAFYSYQEDSWAGMDYELGEKELPGKQKYPLSERKKHYVPNPLFQILQKHLF